MTEQEWLTASDPPSMLEFLHGKASKQKLRLFACASCRHIWNQIKDDRSKLAVNVAERFADGTASEEERDHSRAAAADSENEAMRTKHSTLYGLVDNPNWSLELQKSLEVVHHATRATRECVGDNPIHAERIALWVSAKVSCEEWEQACAVTEREWQTFLRDIFGNPFRPVTFSPAWRTTTVVSLAQTIYEDRQLPSGLFDSQRMAILADALEDAGCDNRDILEHCRSGGDHVRGCWVVDLVLGKE